MEFVLHGWRAESGARLGRTEHSTPRCEAPRGSNSATTFQLPGTEPHTQKTLPRHTVCVHSRTPPLHSGRLSDSLDRAAQTQMNWEQVESRWKQLMGSGKENWGKLTDDDLDQISGKREQLAGKIQETYGITRGEAEKQVWYWGRAWS